MKDNRSEGNRKYWDDQHSLLRRLCGIKQICHVKKKDTCYANGSVIVRILAEIVLARQPNRLPGGVSDYFIHCATQRVAVGQEVIHADDAIREGLSLRAVRADDDGDDAQGFALFDISQLAPELVGRVAKGYIGDDEDIGTSAEDYEGSEVSLFGVQRAGLRP